MAIVAKGDYIVLRSVVGLVSQDIKRAPLSQGVVVTFGENVTNIVVNNIVYFDDSQSLSIYHAPSSQNVSVIKKEMLVAVNT